MAITDPMEPTKSSFVKSLLKQLAIAFAVAAVVLALYLMIMSSEATDKSVGKFAYITTNGEYVGKIRGQGRSARSGNQVYFIQEPTGAVIELSVSYIEVRDNPPKLSD